MVEITLMRLEQTAIQISNCQYEKLRDNDVAQQ